MRNVSGEEGTPMDSGGVVLTNFAMQGPKTTPRIEYERIFVLDNQAKLLGEYALRDNCPLEFEDLRRAIPMNGMRHLLSFYQGEYVFTPFRVEDIWVVVLTLGMPRIEERGSIGTLLAAMQVHMPPTLVPALAQRREMLREREGAIETRENSVTRREQRVTQLEAELKSAGKKLKELEVDVRGREKRLNALRDYAIQMQRAFRQSTTKAPVPPAAMENLKPSAGVVPPPT